MTKLVAIGSAHLDVIARSLGDPEGIDQPGEARIEVGGTACNIAINWARMGAAAHLITATDGGALAQMLLEHVRKQGVQVHSEDHEALGVGVFSAHLSQDGELVSAISHMPVENHEFSEEIFEQALLDADLVIADCNLSAPELSNVALECLARGLPLYVAAVSEEKSLRMRHIRSMPALVALNLQEATYFLQHAYGDVPGSAIDKARSIAEYMRCACLLTLGEHGAVFADSEGVIWEKPETLAPQGNRLGAGDGFLAAFSFASAVTAGADPRAAMQRAMRVASVIAAKNQANLGQARPLEQAFEDLGAKAQSDPLTGLANRAGARAGIEKRNQTPQAFPLGIILLDIDHFKKVNDTLGHDRGDVAIQGVSDLLKQTIRQGDIASRWGGEEFVCFLPGADLEQTLQIAERIRSSVEQASILEHWPLTVSVGVSMARQKDQLDETLKKADEALYQSKGNGRNQITVKE